MRMPVSRDMYDFAMMILVIVIVATLAWIGLAMAEPKVDVKIYKNRESGEMTYCETGTLVDPPMQFMGSGSIRESKAESC